MTQPNNKLEIVWMVRFTRQTTRDFKYIEKLVTHGPYREYEDAVLAAKAVDARPTTVGESYLFPVLRRMETPCD
jgi:hypothetical protein